MNQAHAFLGGSTAIMAFCDIQRAWLIKKGKGKNNNQHRWQLPSHKVLAARDLDANKQLGPAEDGRKCRRILRGKSTKEATFFGK
jgi:hypothetical protein